MHLGPVSPNYQSPGIKPQPGNGLGYNPRCLRRDITSYTSEKWTSVNDVVGLIKNYTDVGHFQRAMEGIPLTDFLGVHGGGHAVLGGDPGSVRTSLTLPPSLPLYLKETNQVGSVHFSR